MTEQYASPQAVVFVANALEISEFDFFCLAWREWHGQEADRDIVEPDFGNYLDHGTVPFYVVDFVRKSLSDGSLLSREKQTRLRAQFIYYVPLLISFVLFMYFLLT